MKIKGFEDFLLEKKENEIFESFYQEWRKDSEIDNLVKSINESYLEEGLEDLEDDDERELTSGEKAAYARDFQILTNAQLAAIYLRAKEKSEGENGKYTNSIEGIDGFIDKDQGGSFKITNAALADAIGAESARTVSRTINKFKNLIDGVGETASESIYPKLIKAFDAFSSTRDSDLAALASEAIQDTSVTTARDKYAARLDTSREQGAARRELQKKEAMKIGYAVHDIVKKLRGKLGKKTAQKMAIARISKDTGMEEAKIKKAYLAYLKDKKLSDDFVN